MSSTRSITQFITASAVLLGPVLAQGADDCANAVLITGSVPYDTSMCSDTGTFATSSPQSFCSLSDDVWFRYVAQTTGGLTISTCGSTWDTEIGIYQGNDCATMVNLACNDDFCALQSEITVPCTAGQSYYFQIGYFSIVTVGGNFGAGTLNVSEGPTPLQPPPAPASCTGPDDNLEENDDCPQAVSVGNGTYLDLFVSKTDWDYYMVSVDNGDTLEVDLVFTHANADLDVFLYDVAGCQLFSAGNVGITGALVYGYSATDNESLSWTNTTGSTQDYILKVNVYPPTTLGDCNAYHMVIDGANGAGGSNIGSSYCGPAINNSTGASGVISATGSTIATMNNVTLATTGLPNNQFGIFINSLTQGFVPMPGGSQGTLCLSSPIGRYNAAGQILNTGTNGGFSLALNLSATPTPTGPTTITAGQTWNFQAWYRDLNPGATSNFTDGVQIQF